ncbi:ROK family glucokinase [Marinilactibacillus psychrotolerans]|uniref:Glucokinase n=1 Tax=Marinilactibacillus psychrotolerans TaxID=191770 RepID=A0AAV3WVU4_9LACT|nr:ROK family glucokinase [Marinilactibacillus psychrotolerans]GEL66262.1 glucokinase [Marinilactibacillus psychrotolerans]GEQ34994.1 glucokinase [Marinilactibacillus psychrotolerans]SDC24840.1 glucokinase [Marinilactibacillus psychrotolerans]
MLEKKLIGIDLGGTTIKFAILNIEGHIQTKWSLETDITEKGTKIVPAIIESINHHLDLYNMQKEDFLGIGMGSPGNVSHIDGTVIGAYNLNWKTTQFVKKLIEEGTGIPFFIDNDANVAALGEQWMGAGNNEPNVVFITLGTGVGGGIIINGELVRGSSGAAGEIGHIVIEPHGFDCTCGNQGCLETVASATGVVRLARTMAEEFAGLSLLKESIDNGDSVDAKSVFDAAKEGDVFALRVVDKVCDYLALACGNISNMLNPSTIVIGGGVSKAGEFLADKIREKFVKYAFPPIYNNTKIKIAELGNDAGVIGASYLVLNDSFSES